MNINCQPPLQFVYFSTDTHIPWISHNTLRDRLFKNGVAIRKKVCCYPRHSHPTNNFQSLCIFFKVKLFSNKILYLHMNNMKTSKWLD